MAKTGRYNAGIPEWTKLPQYKEQSAKFNEVKDVEMEGIELAMAEKLVLPRGLRRKRSRTNSIFGSIGETPTKRVRIPELRKVQSEQVPEFSGMLTVLIRGDKNSNETIPLHVDREKALNTASGYIPATLTSDSVSNWKTALSRPINLTTEDPSLVKNYLEWINTRKVPTRERPCWASPEEKSAPDYKEETTLDTEHLAFCYGLGERLKDTKYRNAILSIMRYYVTKERLFPSDRAVAIIYKNTPKGSPARNMMVDFWVYAADAAWLEGESIGAAVCHEFLEDLIPALLRVRIKPLGNVWPWVENVDAYFVGDEGVVAREGAGCEGDAMGMQM